MAFIVIVKQITVYSENDLSVRVAKASTMVSLSGTVCANHRVDGFIEKSVYNFDNYDLCSILEVVCFGMLHRAASRTHLQEPRDKLHEDRFEVLPLAALETWAWLPVQQLSAIHSSMSFSVS